MTRRLNKATQDEFAANVGGTANAVKEIMNALGCSSSKASKIRKALYPHPLGKLDSKALAELFGCKEEALYVRVDTSRKGSTRKVAS